MTAPPYMKLFVAEWTADTQHLTCEQDGAYFRLVRALWRAGGEMAATPDQLARIVGVEPRHWAQIGPAVMALFHVKAGVITHKRLKKEAAKYRETVAARAEAGRKGGVQSGVNRRKSKADSAEANATAKRSNCRHNQNQNQSPIKGLLQRPLNRTHGLALSLVDGDTPAVPVSNITDRVDRAEFQAWAAEFARKATGR